jgi:hypothetical protein
VHLEPEWMQRVSLELVGRLYYNDLIILSGQLIDVTLGMSWMKWHKAMLDIATCLVHLNSPVYGKVTLHLPVISHIKASLHHMVEKRLKEIHVVQEFPNVFLDDLQGMPRKRAIEFKIELQPSIASIAKSPYRITPVELAELKIHLKDLLNKGYQSHHHGVEQSCL